MDIATLSLLLLVGILFFLLIGAPLGFATGVLGAAIIYLKFGMPGVGVVMQRMYGLCTQYTIIAVPLFIFMACLLERSGIARDMYDSLNVFLRRMRGGIAVITAIMAVIMAAMSGIIGGEIVLLGLIALPQMLRLRYDQNLAIGTICASGSLGSMIPPSIVLIIYGLVTSTSIHNLFIAAVIPGLLLAALYIAYIIVRVNLNPSLAPPDPNVPEDMPLKEKLRYLRGIIPPLLLVVVVLGSIYGGVTGITEAAGMGVSGVLLIIFFRGELTRKLFTDALRRTFKSTGMIVWIMFGATVLAGAYTLSGGPTYVANAIVSLDIPPIGILLTMMLIFLVLGMFLDWVGIVLLTMPVFLPIVLELGYDPIWFGILFCINMQVSFLSPPFGGAAFYLKSVAPPHIQLIDIYRSFLPFMAIQIFVLLLVLFFPGIATVLL
ncbi:MAG: TRAP transporter large permease [Gammaproteobacteria bacterium]